MKKRLLIVDDESSIVTLLSFNLEQAGFDIDIAYDGEKAIEKAVNFDFDLIILDLMLPKMNGLDVCQHLREKNMDIPILILTAKDEESDKIRGLDLGADDYITKPFSPDEMIARVKAILRRTKRENNLNSHSLTIADLTVYPDRYEAEINGNPLIFTRKEFELLLYLVQHPREVLSRELLLRAVWHYEFAGDTRIVDVHISHLREKIEPNTKYPSYIKTVRGLGYKLESPT